MQNRTVIRSCVLCLWVVALGGCGGEDSKKPKSSMKSAGAMSGQADRMMVESNTERYDAIVENGFQNATREPLSTFSIDVDTASYANVRRMVRDGHKPPAGAVRIEEMINYFRYNYPRANSPEPFSISVDATTCPWNKKHQLVRIGLNAKGIDLRERPSCNLVFLLDVSGSMSSHDKLPLVKSAMLMLVDRLNAQDRVAIVVYAGATGMVLPSTPAKNKYKILDSLYRLSAGGSTNGGEGIRLAYRVAANNFIKGGVNRVILCTDGDFNVGTTNDSELVNLAAQKARSGITLSVLGFGTGNLNDAMLEKISNRANGNYNYIDSLREARKALVQQIQGTLVTVAKDVKIQVDFNPAYVQEYRLIGYENRMLKTEDFKDDKKDAGDIGAGHQVTALYEVIPPGQTSKSGKVDPSKYQDRPKSKPKKNGEMLTVRLRYKHPTGKSSHEVLHPLKVTQLVEFSSAPEDVKFAASVAAFGMLLRNSMHKGSVNLKFISATAKSALGKDPNGFRREFLNIVARSEGLE